MKILKRILFFIAILMVIYLARIPLLQKTAQFLRVDNATKGADVMVILSGDPFTRVPKAAQMFKDGYADQMLTIDREADKKRNLLEEMGYRIPDPNLTPIQLLMREGIPESNIIRISTSQATSTIDEARILKEFCQEHPLKRFIIVTTSFHTARAYWIFRKIFKGSNIQIEVAAADHPTYGEKDWWKDESGLISYFNEYIKWMYYLMHY